jgi:DNA polymerase-3 subunit epsilon
MADHTLETTETGCRCTVCLHTWARTPIHSCPGVPWYAWETAPAGLKTKTQIKELGKRLKPNAQPSGCIFYGKTASWIWLYNLDQTEPRPAPTEKQIAAIEKARAKQKELRTCKQCGVEQSSKWDLEFGLCENCHLQIWIAEQRQEASEWARKLLAKPETWLILDTETTGLDEDAEIVQIAVLNPAAGASFQTLVKPQNPIPPGATAIHGITDEMVQHAPDFTTVYQKLAEFLIDKTIVIYNASFDTAMLSQTAARYGLEIYLKNTACAMEQYAAYCGVWNDYWKSFKWQRLPAGDHTALGDCLATLKIIKEMAST